MPTGCLSPRPLLPPSDGLRESAAQHGSRVEMIVFREGLDHPRAESRDVLAGDEPRGQVEQVEEHFVLVADGAPKVHVTTAASRALLASQHPLDQEHVII